MPTQKSDILKQALWFSRRLHFDLDADFFSTVRPQRSVSTDGRYISGVFRSEKCGRDVQYESGQERDFFYDMEKNPAVLHYWEQPVKIPYKRGKVRRYYTPDAAVFTARHEIIIVEIKPLSEMLDHRVQAKIEGLMDFCSRRGFGLLLTDGRNTPKVLLKGKVNRPLEKELAAALETGMIRRAQYKEIKERTKATAAELYRAVIRLDLKYSGRSFRLTRGNQSPVFRQVYFGKRQYDDLTQENFSTLNLSHTTKNKP